MTASYSQAFTIMQFMSCSSGWRYYCCCCCCVITNTKNRLYFNLSMNRYLQNTHKTSHWSIEVQVYKQKRPIVCDDGEDDDDETSKTRRTEPVAAAAAFLGLPLLQTYYKHVRIENCACSRSRSKRNINSVHKKQIKQYPRPPDITSKREIEEEKLYNN